MHVKCTLFCFVFGFFSFFFPQGQDCLLAQMEIDSMPSHLLRHAYATEVSRTYNGVQLSKYPKD